MNFDELVSVNDGIVMTTSLKVAEVFGKQHYHVIDKIKEKQCLFNATNFRLVEYKDKKGEARPMYLLDRDFTTYLIMGFTGTKADEWKIKYINAFNKMEEAIKNSNILSEQDKLRLMLFSKDPSEVVYAHQQLVEIEKRPLIEKIEEQKAFVDFAKHVTQSTDTINMDEMAKLLKNENCDIGRNKLFKILRSEKILMDSNVPYQRFIDNGWFEVIEAIRNTPYGSKVFPKTLVTGKGQIGIVELIRKKYGNF